MEEPTGHIWVIIVLVLAGFPVALQTALTAFVQVGRHINAGAVLQKGLSGLLQAPNLILVFQHGLPRYINHTHKKNQMTVNAG